MSNSEYRENYFRLKHTLSSIRKELENKIDVSLNDIDLSKINDNLSKINRINSKLAVFNKNIIRLEDYLNVLQQYSKNISVIEEIELSQNLKKTDTEKGINSFLFRIYRKFNIISSIDEILDISINEDPSNIYDKLDFELSALIQELKEVLNHFKPIIDDYRNNIQMLPVFEASKRNIEKSLVDYINDKKTEIDLHFNSLKDEVNNTRSSFNFLNNEINNLKKIHSSINEGQNQINIKNTQLSKSISDLDINFKNKQNEIDIKVKLEIENLKDEIHSKFEKKLLNLNNQLEGVNSVIDDEVNSIKNTSKNFKDFVSDETSIKLTNDYKNKANIEMYAYYGLNLLSLIIICLAITISWFSLNTFAEAHIGTNKSYNAYDLAYLSIRLIFSLLIFSSVAFTSKLASKSYIYWKKNEGIFLRLTALKSFIADMSKEKREEIHEKLVDVYFGKDETENNTNQKIKDLPNNLTQLLGKIVDNSSNLLDSKKDEKKEPST